MSENTNADATKPNATEPSDADLIRQLKAENEKLTNHNTALLAENKKEQEQRRIIKEQTEAQRLADTEFITLPKYIQIFIIIHTLLVHRVHVFMRQLQIMIYLRLDLAVLVLYIKLTTHLQ